MHPVSEHSFQPTSCKRVGVAGGWGVHLHSSGVVCVWGGVSPAQLWGCEGWGVTCTALHKLYGFVPKLHINVCSCVSFLFVCVRPRVPMQYAESRELEGVEDLPCYCLP